MDEEHHHRHLHFQLELNPVFICLIGILCGLAIVAILHCIAMGWCRCCCQRRPRIIRRTQEQEYPSIPNMTADSEGGDHQLITAYKHKEGKESTCAVCLGEFAEGEAIRALPECAHSFHVPCIDVWLRSNPSCPLCRAGTGPPPQPSPHVAVCLSSSGGVPPPPEILYL